MGKSTGSMIRELRKEKNLTQVQLANLVNVSDKAISKWENEEGLPDIENLKRLATIFNVSVDTLIMFEKQKENNEPINKDWKRLLGASILIVLYFLPFVEFEVGFPSNEAQSLTGGFKVELSGFEQMINIFKSFTLGNLLISIALFVILVFSIMEIVAYYRAIDIKIRQNTYRGALISAVGVAVLTIISYLSPISPPAEFLFFSILRKFAIAPFIVCLLVIVMYVYEMKRPLNKK